MPVINKIDLPAAEPERVAHEVEDVIGLPCLDAPRISAKTGENIAPCDSRAAVPQRDFVHR